VYSEWTELAAQFPSVLLYLVVESQVCNTESVVQVCSAVFTNLLRLFCV